MHAFSGVSIGNAAPYIITLGKEIEPLFAKSYQVIFDVVKQIHTF